GYATKPLDVFLQQLRQYNIDVIADIRSVPYSSAFHDYAREPLQRILTANELHYVYLGKELGPRSHDPGHYDETGQVQFDRLRRGPDFLSGIARLRNGLSKGHKIALMCAEKDAAFCHRSLLVGYHLLHEENLEVQHLTFSGELESQTVLEKRLISIHELEQDLFLAEGEQAAEAYRQQVIKHSYRKSGAT
ncbi:MAG: DUF488 family protein, partial [Pseudohongiellaceae bacterium]